MASYLYNTWSSAFTPDPPVVSAGATVMLAAACLLLLLRTRLLGAQARFVSNGGRGAPAGGVRLGLGTVTQVGARRAVRAVSRGHDVRPDRGARADLGGNRADAADRSLAPVHAQQLADDRPGHTGPLDPEHRRDRGRRRRPHLRGRRARHGRGAPVGISAAPFPAVRHAFPPGHPGDHHRDRVLLDLPAGQSPGERAAEQHLGDHAGAQRPLAHDRVFRDVRRLRHGQPVAGPRGSLRRRELVDGDDPDHPPDPAARAVRVVRPAVHLDPERLRPGPVSRHARPRDHGRLDAGCPAAGHERTGRGAGHGASRDNGGGDHGRRPGCSRPGSGKPLCLKSSWRA